MPSAYGAIVSPQVETASSVQSTAASRVTSSNQTQVTGSAKTSIDKVATLKDSSKITYRSISSTSKPVTVEPKTADTKDSLSNPAEDLSQINDIEDTEQEALEAVGFEQKNVVEAVETKTPSNRSGIANTDTYPEDEYIKPTITTNPTASSNNNSSSNSNAENELRAPTNPKHSSTFGTRNTDNISDKNAPTKAVEANKSKIGQRVDDSKTLAASFKEDTVQRSLQRLSQYYKQQADVLRERLNNSDQVADGTPIIEAQKLAPAVSASILDLQYDTTSAPRCEGVWVTPNNAGDDTTYQQAIQRAQQQDGLSTANGLPLHAVADYGYYDNENYVELAGNVEIKQDGKTVTADEIALDINSGIAGAKGGVLLADSGKTQTSPSNNNENPSNNNQGGIIAVAEELAYSTNDSRATAYDVAFASVPMQAHGYAKTMNKSDDVHYGFEKVMFSTCPPTDRKWQIEAEQIDIDTDSGRGEAYDATFRLGEVPVLYLPYFNFPVDDRRSSGLLIPSARIDSDTGLKLSVPYYLNLAPNYDATVTTDVYSNRNPMVTAEVRYLTDGYGEGSLTTAYMPNDKEYGDEDRTGIFYNHEWASETIPRLTADVVYNYVSDPDYINDFDDFGVVENQLNLPRRGRINYYDDFIDAELKVETFQTLEAEDAQGDIVEDKDKPYSRLPQLTVNYRLPKFNNIFDNFEITGTHDSAYFKKSINDDSAAEQSGVRVYNEISASYPIEKTWGYIKPEVSLQHLYTAYDEESRLDNNISKDDNDQSVFVPGFSLDSALNFYNAGTPFNWFDDSMGGYQVLSPRLKYTYAPYEDQSDIPNFDTGFASLDYDQLFADSWFLGHDRIADSNSLAVGLNYRYIDAMGITRFDGGIGDEFFLDKPRVGLEADEGTLDVNSTGVAWRSSLQPYRNLWFDINGAFNSDNELSYVTSQIRYNPTPNSLINFGVIDRKRDPITNQSDLSALTAATIIPINDNWRFLGQGQYDTDENKFIDATVGIDYEDCCYGFSIYGRSYYNDLNLNDDPTRAIMAEFRINGFGERKSRLSKHLDDKILGIEPVDYLWKR